MNGSSQFCFHRDHSRMSKRHQEPALVFRELKPKCCFVLTRFQVFEVQGTEFWKPQAALGFGSSHTDSEEQCLEKCECPLCVGTVTVLSACPWRPLGVTKGPRKLTLHTHTQRRTDVQIADLVRPDQPILGDFSGPGLRVDQISATARCQGG